MTPFSPVGAPIATTSGAKKTDLIAWVQWLNNGFKELELNDPLVTTLRGVLPFISRIQLGGGPGLERDKAYRTCQRLVNIINTCMAEERKISLPSYSITNNGLSKEYGGFNAVVHGQKSILEFMKRSVIPKVDEVRAIGRAFGVNVPVKF